jgi:phospholipid/cholesterol/gamma-HCH transport system ATP-binding protein
MLELVDLADHADKKPHLLSGGQKQRVGIARAIVLKPKYLFCDEPNSGLDPKTSILIDNLIYELTTELNITTIVITHDMNSVMEIGEKIVFLKNGLLEWEGTNKEIIFSKKNNNPRTIIIVL